MLNYREFFNLKHHDDTDFISSIGVLTSGSLHGIFTPVLGSVHVHDGSTVPLDSHVSVNDLSGGNVGAGAGHGCFEGSL